MDSTKLLDALKMIKAAFVTEKFMDAKLQDGTIIRFDGDKLDIGVAVNVVSDAGVVPIPDGEYYLEDGTEFKTVNGVVSEIKMVEEVPAPEAAAPEAVQAPAPASAMTETQAKSIIESIIKETHFAINERIEKLEAESKTKAESFASANSEVETLKATIEKQEKTILALFSLVEKIANEPSAKPAETKKAFNIYDFKKNYKQDLINIQETI